MAEKPNVVTTEQLENALSGVKQRYPIATPEQIKEIIDDVFSSGNEDPDQKTVFDEIEDRITEKVENETERATGKEEELEGRIESVEGSVGEAASNASSALEKAESAESKVDEEKTRAEGAENDIHSELDGAIKAEVSRATAEEQRLAALISESSGSGGSGDVDLTDESVVGPLPIAKGGTGATTEDDIRTVVVGFGEQIRVPQSRGTTVDTARSVDNILLLSRNSITPRTGSNMMRNVIVGQVNSIQDISAENTVVGTAMLKYGGDGNTGIGHDMLNSDRVSSSIAIGHHILERYGLSDGTTARYYKDTNEVRNIVIGATIGSSYYSTFVDTVAIGYNSVTKFNTVKEHVISDSVIIGKQAMESVLSNTEYCVAIGSSAFNYQGSIPNPLSNSTAIGANSIITGSNQVQLGSSGTSTYAYGSVQNRSDARDKTNIMDIEYPYKKFIMGLRPITFQWDYREDYLKDIPDPEPDPETGLTPAKPTLSDITHDGTHTRTRRHNGMIAQEVKALADELGFDFAGYQDHNITGGGDVLSLGYEEFIPPMIKVIQDQEKEIQDLKSRLEKLEAILTDKL